MELLYTVSYAEEIKEFMLVVVKMNRYAFEYAHEILKRDKYFVWKVVNGF